MPRWIKITSCLIALLGLFVGVSLYVSPATFIPNVNFQIKDNRFLAAMWGARQIAVALVIGYGCIKASAVTVRAALLVYCIMNVQDIGIGLYMHDVGLIAGAAFFTLLSGGMVIRLSRTCTN